MKTVSKRNWWNRIPYLLLLGAALANSGCLLAAAGAAGGGAAVAGYAYAKGKVCDEFNASFGDVWLATHAALADLGMPVLQEERTESTGFIKTQLANGDKVRIQFDIIPSKIPREGPQVKLAVRVGTFGDQPASDKILLQIGKHVTIPGLAGPAAPGVVLQPPNIAAPPAQPMPARGQSPEPPVLDSTPK
jgi:hypothetical protein